MVKMVNPLTPYRRHLIARVHVLKKNLCLDEEEYRALLQRIGGAESCKLLNNQKLGEMVNYLNAYRRSCYQEETPAAFDNQQMVRKLWAQAYDLTAVDGDHCSQRSRAYLTSLAKRMCHGKNWQHATGTELHSMIAAMEYERQRRGIYTGTE